MGLKKVQKRGRNENTRRPSCCREVVVKKDWMTTLLLLSNYTTNVHRVVCGLEYMGVRTSCAHNVQVMGLACIYATCMIYTHRYTWNLATKFVVK